MVDISDQDITLGQSPIGDNYIGQVSGKSTNMDLSIHTCSNQFIKLALNQNYLELKEQSKLVAQGSINFGIEDGSNNMII